MKIAITGGIGSGKTTVCKYIEKLGYKVFYSDLIAKELVNTNNKLQSEIINEFGIESFINNKYNAIYIANIVFNNSEKLEKLNYIFKPYIDENFEKISNENENFFYESALIFEHKIEHKFDYIISTIAWKNVIIDRVMKRNNISKEDIIKIIDSQLSNDFLIEKSDFYINTCLGNGYMEQEIKNIIFNFLKI